MVKPDFYKEADLTFGDTEFGYLPAEPGTIYKKARARQATDPESGIQWQAIEERVGKLNGFEVTEGGSFILTRHNSGYSIIALLDLETGNCLFETSDGTEFPEDWLSHELNRGQEIVSQLGRTAQQVSSCLVA